MYIYIYKDQLYIYLYIYKDQFGENVGLYRDDGLAVVNTKSGRLCDKVRKELVRTFDNLGLKITVLSNQTRTNFLDLTFDLTNGTHNPYRKPNDEPLYINSSSNHPPSIIRELPKSINKRINQLSSNKDIFDIAAPTYNEALKHSNFTAQLKYEPTDTNTCTKRNRQRNILWFNPPFSKNVKTNIARDFLQLIDKHFPPNNKLSKLFNRHNVRVSYSCNENMRTFINRHNKAVLNRHNKRAKLEHMTDGQHDRNCNCRQPDLCPVNGYCLSSNVIFKAEVTTDDNNNTRSYIGATANNFKTRYRNHCKSMAHRKYSTETELSKHIWVLKDSNRSFFIKWSIVKQLKAPKTPPKNCLLCLQERLLILKERKNNILNKRSELLSACRHVT